MAKKIVQLENNDGDQIFPISATDIALPGTKVAMRSASDPVTISTTRVSIVSTTVDSDGDYLAIGSVSAGSGSQEAIYCYAFIDNGTDSTTYVTNISTIPTGRPCMTVMGKITGLHQGDTVRLSAQAQSSSYSTNSRDQSLALIKLPTGAPTYKGGAVEVTLNAGGMGWSGATTSEMYNAIHNGKPVVLQGAGLDSGYALLQSMNISVRYSWGAFIDPYGRTKYIRFDDTLDMWRTTDMTVAESYNTYEMETGGTWIDGKPIYKKTLTRASGIPTGNFTVAHGINDLATVIDIKVVSTNGSGNTSFPAVVSTSGGNFWNAWSANPTNIEFFSSVTTSNPLYITIYYTKTTD